MVTTSELLAHALEARPLTTTCEEMEPDAESAYVVSNQEPHSSPLRWGQGQTRTPGSENDFVRHAQLPILSYHTEPLF